MASGLNLHIPMRPDASRCVQDAPCVMRPVPYGDALTGRTQRRTIDGTQQERRGTRTSGGGVPRRQARNATIATPAVITASPRQFQNETTIVSAAGDHPSSPGCELSIRSMASCFSAEAWSVDSDRPESCPERPFRERDTGRAWEVPDVERERDGTDPCRPLFDAESSFQREDGPAPYLDAKARLRARHAGGHPS